MLHVFFFFFKDDDLSPNNDNDINDDDDNDGDDMLAFWQGLQADLIVRDWMGAPMPATSLAAAQDGRHGQQSGPPHPYD